ncbi:hypothetical protein GSB9_01272 [Flavobacteriaceae bacterium GSB9]|nr:hypothetical protein GSB9_01272 [Flavobacteriaceae bacterium GSB9]
MKDKKMHSIKKTGFKVPNNYFDTLEDDLLPEIKLKTNLERSGFTVPKTYFSDLDSDIINKIQKENEPKVISIVSKKNLIYISSVAAAVLLLFSLSVLNTKPETTFDSLDVQTVENYILEEDIGAYEINTTLTEDDFYAENFTDVTIDDDSFETYILNDINIEDIMLE